MLLGAGQAQTVSLAPGAFHINARAAGQRPDWGRQAQPRRTQTMPPAIVTRQTVEETLRLARHVTPNVISEEFIDASVELLLQTVEKTQTQPSAPKNARQTQPQPYAPKNGRRLRAALTKKLSQRRHQEEPRFPLLGKLRKKLSRSPYPIPKANVMVGETSSSSEPHDSCGRHSRLGVTLDAPTTPLHHQIPPAIRESWTSSEGSAMNCNPTENSVIRIMAIFPDSNRALVEEMIFHGNSEQMVLSFLAEQSGLADLETDRPSTIAGVSQRQGELRASRIMEAFPSVTEETVRELLDSGDSTDQIIEDLTRTLSTSAQL